MKSKLLICALTSLFFIACKKSSTTNTSSTGWLKSITNSNNPTFPETFTYNANNKVITDGTESISRNSSDIIIAYNDGTQEVVYYNNASGHYSYKNISNGVSDSIVFIYSGSRISELDEYRTPTTINTKLTYLYDTNGNVSVFSYYGLNSSNMLIVKFRYTYTYDNQVNPVPLKNEAPVLAPMSPTESGVIIGPNNPTSILSENLEPTPTTSSTTTITYTYNSVGKPISNTYSSTDGTTGTTTYMYY